MVDIIVLETMEEIHTGSNPVKGTFHPPVMKQVAHEGLKIP